MGIEIKNEIRRLNEMMDFDIEDHPFQPRRVETATPQSQKEEHPRVACSRLKTCMHGHRRLFERTTLRQTTSQDKAINS